MMKLSTKSGLREALMIKTEETDFDRKKGILG